MPSRKSWTRCELVLYNNDILYIIGCCKHFEQYVYLMHFFYHACRATLIYLNTMLSSRPRKLSTLCTSGVYGSGYR